MYCVIQFYIQLRADLAPHKPLIKVTAIKLVIFLSFWQTFMISILTSTFNVLEATEHVAYPDLKVGIPSFLLCVEMAIFAIMHIFAYPYKPYITGSEQDKYPSSHDPSHPDINKIGPKQGGPLGIRAIVDAMNPWDLVKAFGRGIRWIIVGRRHRENDVSYKMNSNEVLPDTSRTTTTDSTYKGAVVLPIAEQFRRSKFGLPTDTEEGAGLIAHAQAQPYRHSASGRYTPARERYDPQTGQEISSGGRTYDGQVYQSSPSNLNQMYSEDPAPTSQIGVASSRYGEAEEPLSPVRYNPPQEIQREVRAQRPQVVAVQDDPMSQSVATHQALWGSSSGTSGPNTPSSAGASQGRDLKGDYGGKI